jgi:hypothetical protein
MTGAGFAYLRATAKCDGRSPTLQRHETAVVQTQGAVPGLYDVYTSLWYDGNSYDDPLETH